MKLPLMDLQRQYSDIQSEADEVVCTVLSSANYIVGEQVKAFEQEFASYIGVPHAVSVANGTDALVIALKALGIGVGDEVITTAYTFFATAESISAVGAVPVFVDVCMDTYNMDVMQIESRITKRTKAIMPVHIFGLCADMDKINQIALKHGLAVIEDACQAAGAEYCGKKAGSLATVACFSFFPTKNLGCAGDGGMIVTRDSKLATICRALRMHGSGENGQRAYNLLNHIDADVEQDLSTDNTVYNPLKYYNYLIGHNSRLDEIQAALLRIKLVRLDSYISKRRQHADYYTQNLTESKVVLPTESKNCKHAYHLYILQAENREALTEYLGGCGVATGIYYPVPMHLQKVYGDLGYKLGDLPNSEYLSSRTFAIPMFPEMTADECTYVVECIRRYIK